jgi:hypothetical protein
MVTGTQLRDAYIKAANDPRWKFFTSEQQWKKWADVLNEQQSQEERIASLEARVSALESKEVNNAS